VRLEIEEVEPDTGDVSDENINGVEHGENIALHEYLMLQRFVTDGIVGLCDEFEDSRVRLWHRRIFGGLDTGVGFVDQPSSWGSQGSFDDLWSEEVHWRVIVRLVLALLRGRVHDRACRRRFEFRRRINVQLRSPDLDQRVLVE